MLATVATKETKNKNKGYGTRPTTRVCVCRVHKCRLTDGCCSFFSMDQELQSSPRIIGGDDAVVGRFPYTVSLQSVSNLRHFCGASLIAPDMVLSAAHCSNLPSNVAVRTNAHQLNNPIDTSEVLPVSQVVVHPDYASQARIDHDVMVLKLAQPSMQRPLVRINPSEEVPAVGDLMYVMGWGTTISGQDAPPDVLQFSESFAITNEVCVEISLGGDVLGEDYEGDITDDMMCALEEGQGSCQGDSGECFWGRAFCWQRCILLKTWYVLCRRSHGGTRRYSRGGCSSGHCLLGIWLCLA